jgi:hypothetical protein
MSIPVRCQRCGRVRVHSPGPGVWTEHPELIRGEVTVICRTCLDLWRVLAAKRQARMDRKLLRDRARGYGSTEGDPFAGFE